MPKDKYMMLQNHNITIIRLLLLFLKISYFVLQFVVQNSLNVQFISYDFFLNYYESSVFNSYPSLFIV